jgi:hypothetical protein
MWNNYKNRNFGSVSAKNKLFLLPTHPTSAHPPCPAGPPPTRDRAIKQMWGAWDCLAAGRRWEARVSRRQRPSPRVPAGRFPSRVIVLDTSAPCCLPSVQKSTPAGYPITRHGRQQTKNGGQDPGSAADDIWN